MHSVHPGAALEQVPVEDSVILIGLTAEEGLNLQAVVPGDQPGHRGELMLTLKPDQVSAGLWMLVGQAETVQGSLDGAAGGSFIGRHDGYAPTRAATSSIAPVYTLASRSTVADQPKADACRRAPADIACRRRGALTRRLITRAHSAGS